KFTFDRKTGAGVELYRRTARYITVSGFELGSCPALPSLDSFIETLLARYSGEHDGFDFNQSGSQGIDYDDLIRNGAPEGERSELFQAAVWHLASKGFTVEQITDELGQYPGGIAAKFADRLHAEVTRSVSKWRTRKRAAAIGGMAENNSPWPQIYIR